MKKLMIAVSMAFAAAMPLMAETETVGGYTWTYRILEDDTAEIYKGYYSAAISPNPTGAVTIPSMLGGKPVTGIGQYAFRNCSGLTASTDPTTMRKDHARWNWRFSARPEKAEPFGIANGARLLRDCSAQGRRARLFPQWG